MSDKPPTPPPSGSGGTVLPRRSPGHRGQDQRDTVAEMIQKAHEISLEAGSKMATAMKDVIFAAAGLTPFAAESAKDLINYMVRRGQMGSEEAERIIRDIEAAAEKRGGAKPVPKPAPKEEPVAQTYVSRSAYTPFSEPIEAPAPIVAPKPVAATAPKPAVKKAAVVKKPAAAKKAPPAKKKK